MEENNIIEQERPRHHGIVLSAEGQTFLSIIDSHSKTELPTYIDGKIIEVVNSIALEFNAKVRTAVVDILFTQPGEHYKRERQELEGGRTKTIVDKDWHEEEKKIETAIRFFPDVVLEKRQGYYPIQWTTMRNNGTKEYNLRNISLIPLVVELGNELQQFDKERGGLLSTNRDGTRDMDTLSKFCCYYRKGNETIDLLDRCIFAVQNRLREKNYIRKEDIQQYNLFGLLCSSDIGSFLASRLWYYINWDPLVLSIPCRPEKGNFLPIHWSTLGDSHEEKFFVMVEAGMRYFPGKIGFIFCEGTVTRQQSGRSVDRVSTGTAFQLACKKFGKKKVTNEVIDRITKYCTATRSAATVESSLLMSAVSDESIHMDCLYLLVRKDPVSALMRLRKLLLGDEETTTTNSTNNNDSNDGSNSTVAISYLLETTSSSANSKKRKHNDIVGNNRPSTEVVGPAKKK